MALLGSAALSQTLPVSATAYLQAQALPGGGWEWAPGWGADTNTTALALQALRAAGEPKSAPTALAGLAFLHATQNDDGGFPYAPGADARSDANSTAYAVQALIALGENPAGPGWAVNGQTPVDFLLGLQLADGSFEWQPGAGSNLLATQQAIPALLGRSYPMYHNQLARCPAVYLPLVQRQ
jgi:prenyltransferase beta subunit